jgi:glycerophosphoryl diester phosphodiesterase
MSQFRGADWLIAHRGYPQAYPENSLAGVEAALLAGARYVEFDIQMSRDGVPVVVHDDSLGRVGDSDEQIADLDWEALSTRSIGEPNRFGPRFAQQRVPGLADMLSLVDRYPDVTAFVEIKRESIERFGRSMVATAVHDCLGRASSFCVPISFDAAVLGQARERGAEVIGLVLASWSEAARREAEQLGPDYLFIQADRIPEGGRPLWPGEWQWVVYVVDDPDSARAFRDRGADMIETDRFPPMLKALSDSQWQ